VGEPAGAAIITPKNLEGTGEEGWISLQQSQELQKRGLGIQSRVFLCAISRATGPEGHKGQVKRTVKKTKNKTKTKRRQSRIEEVRKPAAKGTSALSPQAGAIRFLLQKARTPLSRKKLKE